MNYVWLKDRLSLVQEVLDGYGLPFRWEPNPPATEAQIVQCETNIGLPLPPSHRSFLLIANGARLEIAPEYEILSTERIVEVTHEMRAEDYEGQRFGNLIACVAYNGGCDRLVLEPERLTDGEYAVLDAFHEEGPSDWRMPGSDVAASFGGWLSRALNAVGMRHERAEYWILPGKPIRDLAEEHKRTLEVQKRADQGFRW